MIIIKIITISNSRIIFTIIIKYFISYITLYIFIYIFGTVVKNKIYKGFDATIIDDCLCLKLEFVLKFIELFEILNVMFECIQKEYSTRTLEITVKIIWA